MSGVMVVRLHGRLLAVKRQGPNGPDRLRREAEVLGGLSHPGLVQLVDVSATEPIELRTVFVGPASWDRMPPSAPERVAALAAVAATVADLHELDTTHGAVHPSHVLTADDDRPVLCGLADAGPADDDGRARDLDGLAGLLEDIGGGAEPASVRARIDDLATRCRAGSLDARSLARELDHLARPSPPARTGVLTALDARRGTRVALVAAPLLVGWLALHQMSSPPTSDDPSDAPPGPAEEIASPTVAPASRAPSPSTASPSTTAPTTTAGPPTTGPMLAPADAGPPPELDHDGRHYTVGQAGDRAVLGDWDCDGIPTVAVLRPATGLVVVFDDWPAPGETSEPLASHEFPGALDLRVEADGGCDALRVDTADGSLLVRPGEADPAGTP